MMEISCSECGQYLITYQKDGPGPLKRCYWDRIHAPMEMSKLEEKVDQPEEFSCPSCNLLVGKKIFYKKEPRMAFALIEGTFCLKEIS